MSRFNGFLGIDWQLSNLIGGFSVKIDLTKEEGETATSACQMAIDLMQRSLNRTVNPSIRKAVETSIHETKLIQSKFKSVSLGQSTVV